MWWELHVCTPTKQMGKGWRRVPPFPCSLGQKKRSACEEQAWPSSLFKALGLHLLSPGRVPSGWRVPRGLGRKTVPACWLSILNTFPRVMVPRREEKVGGCNHSSAWINTWLRLQSTRNSPWTTKVWGVWGESPGLPLPCDWPQFEVSEACTRSLTPSPHPPHES